MGLLAGCDRETAETAQPEASPTETRAATPKKGELTGTVDRSHKGSMLPDFTVKDPSGRELKLKELKGPVLINLWATWCVPCVTELPLLDKLAAERQQLKVLTISEDMGDGAKVAAFMKQRGLIKLEPWLDPANDLAFQFGGNLPTTILYDSAGKEVWRVIGGYDWASPAAARLLDEGR